MKILLAVDQSRNALAAARWAQGLPLPAGSILYLLHVFELKQWPEWSAFDDARQFQKKVSTVWEKATTKARRFIDRLADSFPRPRLEVQANVAEGIPGAEILTAVEQHSIDLVVVGTKGLSGIKRFLLGSVSEWVLSDAPCSVMAAPLDQPQSQRDACLVCDRWVSGCRGRCRISPSSEAPSIVRYHSDSCGCKEKLLDRSVECY